MSKMGFLTFLFGNYAEKEVNRILPTVESIEALEPEMQKLDDEALRAKTAEFRERYKSGETLEELLPEAFAVVREATVRVQVIRLFHVQLIGGVVLHQGRIAEMKTGEG